jgi:hypothetical protein
METIKVYHSLWKNGLLVAVSFGFTSLGIFLINAGKDSTIAWLTTLLFGIGGLFMLWLMLKERITHTPYYIITDDGIIMNSGLKTVEVHFADVKCFFLTEVKTAGANTKLIGIQYKENVELQKFKDASLVGRAVRSFNKSVAGSQEGLPADGLTIKPKVLCEILNERLNSN